jgi:hypothetical protein
MKGVPKVTQLTTIENLSTEECLRLLASQPIGRLAVAGDERRHRLPGQLPSRR